MMILLNIAFAMSSGGAQTTDQPAGGMMGGLITLGLIFLVFYFLLIKPQQKQQKKLAGMRDNLRSGDKIVTTGGIFGTIESVSSETVILKIADKVKIEIAKNAIAGLKENGKRNTKNS